MEFPRSEVTLEFVRSAISSSLPPVTEKGAMKVIMAVAKNNCLGAKLEARLFREDVGGHRLWLMTQLVTRVKVGKYVALPEVRFVPDNR
jgi:hypothetical protein